MTLSFMLTTVEKAHRALFIGALVFLMCLLFLCLLRAVKGPRVADRIVAVNMMGTMVMVMIVILALLLGEGYLVDICLIYAMVSFISVIVLTKVYMGVYRQKKTAQEAEAAKAAMESMAAGGEAGGGTEMSGDKAGSAVSAMGGGTEMSVGEAGGAAGTAAGIGGGESHG